jgi:site-specific recombinase XerD
VNEQNVELARKLAGVGLIAPLEDVDAVTLMSFIDRYVEGRTEVKPATKEVWRQGKLGLVEYFGGTRALASVTTGDADAYKLKLISDGLATMTVRERLQFAKTVFRSAVRHKLIGDNPFADVTIKAGMPDRRRFITPYETERILEACNPQWQL